MTLRSNNRHNIYITCIIRFRYKKRPSTTVLEKAIPQGASNSFNAGTLLIYKQNKLIKSKINQNKLRGQESDFFNFFCTIQQHTFHRFLETTNSLCFHQKIQSPPWFLDCTNLQARLHRDSAHWLLLVTANLSKSIC